MSKDDPQDLEDEPEIPFPEEVVLKRRKRRGGISGQSDAVLIGAGLHYMAGNFAAARAMKIFRNHI